MLYAIYMRILNSLQELDTAPDHLVTSASLSCFAYLLAIRILFPLYDISLSRARSHSSGILIKTHYLMNKNGAGRNNSAKPPNSELPPPIPSFPKRAPANRGKAAPNEERNKSFRVKTDAISEKYTSLHDEMSRTKRRVNVPKVCE